jgi:hypothetical protein
MPRLISRVLLAFEMLLLGVLVTPPFFMYGFALTDSIRPNESLAALVWFISIGSFLLAAYRVAFAFIHKGPTALRTLNKAWWRLSYAGAAYAVLTTLWAPHYRGGGKDLGFMVATTGIVGLLYLIPLAHVLLERRFRKF